MRAHTEKLSLLIVAAGLIMSPVANGAETFVLDTFRPTTSLGNGILNVSTSRLLPHLAPAAGLVVSYADDLLTLVRTDDDATLVDRLVDDRLTLHVDAAIGFFGYAELGIGVPLHVSQSGVELSAIGAPGTSASGYATGDLRVVPKVRFWDPRDAQGFGLHISLPIHFPLDTESPFVSDGDIRFEAQLGLDYRHAATGIHIAGSVGYHHRAERIVHNISVGPTLGWGLGVRVPVGLTPLRIDASLFGDVSFSDNIDLNDGTLIAGDREQPIEFLAGPSLEFGEWTVHLAAGAGIVRDVGAPTWRFIGGIGFTPVDDFLDADGDGVGDSADACPRVAEDIDGFEDGDGCPDNDNDNDQVADSIDKCPNVPEDIDGQNDADGCPDKDDDGDGVPEEQDRCPAAPEDIDGFEDEDGCPDVDNDKDGFEDAIDDCPIVPEDLDGFQDDDGCPEPDNDGDGILDGVDQCPDFAETVNGDEDEDGCPE